MIRAAAVNSTTGAPVLIIGLTFDDLSRLVEEVVEFDTAGLEPLPGLEVWVVAAKDRDGILELLPPSA